MSARYNAMQGRQHGAALVVSLLILAVMTIIGVTAMSQSSLETLMAGNLQLQTRSMFEAENQLSTAEQAVQNSSITAINYRNYDETIDPIEQLLQAEQASIEAEYKDDYIEYLGPRIIPGESVVIGRETPRAGSEIHLFRNTALHRNRDNGSRRLVQSIYATEQPPLPPALGDGNDG